MSALPRIFISAASREFNTPEFPYRDELHRVLRRGHRRQVRVQADIGPHSDTLLDQLDEYVRNCDAVMPRPSR